MFFFVATLASGFYLGRCERHRQAPTAQIISSDTTTSIKRDTMPPVIAPEPIKKTTQNIKVDPIIIHDTVPVHDSVLHIYTMPRETLTYAGKDSTCSYKAVISGVNPRLDTLQLYPVTKYRTIVQTVSAPVKKFGIGVQTGYFFSSSHSSPYAEINISYKIIRVQAGYTFYSGKLTPYTKIGVSYNLKTF